MPGIGALDFEFVGQEIVILLAITSVCVYMMQNVIKPLRKIEKMLCDIYGDPDTGREGLVQRVAALEGRVDKLERE